MSKEITDGEMAINLMGALKLAYDIIVDRDDLTEDEIDSRMIVKNVLQESKEWIRNKK